MASLKFSSNQQIWPAVVSTVAIQRDGYRDSIHHHHFKLGPHAWVTILSQPNTNSNRIFGYWNLAPWSRIINVTLSLNVDCVLLGFRLAQQYQSAYQDTIIYQIWSHPTYYGCVVVRVERVQPWMVWPANVHPWAGHRCPAVWLSAATITTVTLIYFTLSPPQIGTK